MAEVRPIDANALEKSIRDCYCKGCNSYNGVRCRACNFDDAISVIDDAPTLDYAHVRHGEWTAIDSSYWRWKPDGAHHVMKLKYEHTECGKIVAKKEPYCPNCGAKMDGGKNDG